MRLIKEKKGAEAPEVLGEWWGVFMKKTINVLRIKVNMRLTVGFFFKFDSPRLILCMPGRNRAVHAHDQNEANQH